MQALWGVLPAFIVALTGAITLWAHNKKYHGK